MKPCPSKCESFPSKLIIKHAEIFAPVLTRLINASFAHCTIPIGLKNVCVTPIPKKPNADQKDPSNLRPITNVMFILKLFDKIATSQFQYHIDTNNLLHHGQSGFRKNYSTETALLELQTKLKNTIENNKATLLILLDLSAAYDLVDHDILINRLRSKFHCSPQSCGWIHSFLKDRKSKVTWDTAESPPEPLKYGVPQGSCISPALFNTYLSPLFCLLEEKGVAFTNYADDTQILLDLSGDYTKDSAALNSTYLTVKKWMDENWMCLNGTKTELIIISSKQKRTKLGPNYKSFPLEGTPIPVADKVKTLGVIIDSQLSMTPHCKYIRKNAHYHLKLLRAIRPTLTETHCATVARAVILSRLDYCNALLSSTKKGNIHDLQMIQNTAVRIIAKVPKREHITTARRSLHWLPVAERITFKILCITHKCIAGTAPNYLKTYISTPVQQRPLRSTNSGVLHCPKALKNSGNRSSFAFTAPTAWNRLPPDVRLEKNITAFKKKIKTLLFK